ncbi:MAG TPA: lipid-A-disaccharide synthase [Chlamydiales bacterium]|nr:lipid-A-disaccharide synthase [Chlamydiales bacterium]
MDLFLLAAEPSGDSLGAELVKALLDARPHLQIAAMAGPKLRALPIQSLFPMEKLQVMGFVDVFFSFPSLWKTFYEVRNAILKLNPKAVLLIDYPGFNLRLEASLRKKGYQGKLIHYAAPSVWAWGKKRIPKMAKHLDLLLTLFPFEKTCFASTPLRVEYAGHPLSKLSLLPKKEEPLLALFPGSRKAEIERTFPIQLEAAKKLQALHPDLNIGVSIASKSIEPLILTILQKANITCHIFPPEQKQTLLQSARVAIAKSGTITLELALCQVPTLVTYGVSPLDRFIVQKILSIDLPFYCIVNILLSKEVFPEFFGPNLRIDHLFPALQRLWENGDARSYVLEGCREVQKELGKEDSSRLAARHVLRLLGF